MRTTLLAAAVAALLPLTGTSHASCLDDAGDGLGEGYSPSPASGMWPLYVTQSGPATFTVHGDALVYDYTSFATDTARLAQTYASNAPGVATTFVDCVAG